MTTTKALTPFESLRSSIKQLEPQLKLALPAHVSVDKFTRVLLTSIQQNPALLNADRTSLFSSILRAAAAGLNCDGKECAIVMFKDKAQCLFMLGGLLRLVRQSGELSNITAQLVHKNDVFKYYVDSDGDHLNHTPDFFSDRGDVIGVYAIAKTKDGSIYIEVMTMTQVNAVKNVSRSKDTGPWAGPFKDEMIKKTVLRRLIKRLPLSTDVEQVIADDNETYQLEQIPDEQPAKPQEKEVKQSRLEAIVAPTEPPQEEKKEDVI